MSDRPIQVGDLVQIVKWPCCGHGLGIIFRINELSGFGYFYSCAKCTDPHPREPVAASGWKLTDWSAPVPWLKRIPPLDELEGQRTEEVLREPKVKA